MILINLLPHREERRKRRKAAYFAALGTAAVAGLAIVGVWYLVLEQMTSTQQARNAFLTAEIRKLDVQIKDIATLRAEIEALFDKVEKHSGVRGRWMRRRDDPATYMEVYEGVEDEKLFQRIITKETKDFPYPRKTELFQCA